MVEKDYAGDLRPTLIMPDLNMTLDMTLVKALEFVIGYCNKHTNCENGCRLWDDDCPRCLLRTDTPPCDWEWIIKSVKEQEDE